MINNNRHHSQFQLALQRFRGNKTAMACVFILGFLYFSAVFAEFLSPYSYKDEQRQYSYCPPTPVHFFDQGRLTWPYVYGLQLSFNEFYKREYVTDVNTKYRVKLFASGESYKLLGLIPTRVHLLGVESPGRIYLLGADSRGRDIFSRLIFGGRVSLSIG